MTLSEKLCRTALQEDPPTMCQVKLLFVDAVGEIARQQLPSPTQLQFDDGAPKQSSNFYDFVEVENRSEDNKQGNVISNQSETVMTGLHSETTESEVTVMLKEMMKEIKMDFESVKLVCPAKPITHAVIYFENDNERNKFIRSANMLKRELRGRKIRVTRSMEAEERFYNKRIGYVKSRTCVGSCLQLLTSSDAKSS